MGCDIHAHFEVKINGKWEHYSVPNIVRCYGLFEKMAGVRGDIKNAIVPPKGVPDNLSVITALDLEMWDCDAHTRSWLDCDEIAEVINFHKNLTNDFFIELNEWGFLFRNSFGGLNKYRGDYPEEIEDVRLVFWFDN